MWFATSTAYIYVLIALICIKQLHFFAENRIIGPDFSPQVEDELDTCFTG